MVVAQSRGAAREDFRRGAANDGKSRPRPAPREVLMSLNVEHLDKDYPTRSGPLVVLHDFNLVLHAR